MAILVARNLAQDAPLIVHSSGALGPPAGCAGGFAGPCAGGTGGAESLGQSPSSPGSLRPPARFHIRVRHGSRHPHDVGLVTRTKRSTKIC
jgi:hypothetical protein